MDLRVTLVEDIVRLGPRKYYHFCDPDALPTGESCRNMWNLDPSGTPVEAAIDLGWIEARDYGLVPVGGAASDAFDGIGFMQLLPAGGTCDYPVNYRGHTFPDQYVKADPNHTHRYDVAYFRMDYPTDCMLQDYDFGSAAHEVGHMLAVDGGDHPAGYVSAYELMDSCYPCATGMFTRMPESLLGTESHYFEAWVPAERYAEYAPPASSTEVLAPVEVRSDVLTSPQALLARTALGYYYLAECRRFIGADQWIPLMSPARQEGVLILKVTPGGPRETTLMLSPSRPPEDRWLSSWSPGDVFTDTDADSLD